MELFGGNYINVLELKAILLALESYFKHNCHIKHVHILTDNSTVLAYIYNKEGMHSVLCNNIAKRVWEFAQNKGFWISLSHIPVVENTTAEKMSRVFRMDALPQIVKNFVTSFSLIHRSIWLQQTNRQICILDARSILHCS